MMLKAEALAERLRASEKLTVSDPFIIIPGPNLDDLKESGAASVDLRLGTWFVSSRHSRMSHINISDAHTSQSQFAKTTYVPFGTEYYLHPRSFVLGITLEWIRLPTNLAGYLIGKSSWGRHGLIIATAAGVHPGFKGCLTLELSNIGEVPLPIKPGMKICQLFLHKVEATGTAHVDKSRFVGQRKPTLEKIRFDEVAEKLSHPYGGSSGISS